MSSFPERDLPASRSAASHFDSLGTIMCVLIALTTIGFAAFRFAPVLPVGASHNVDKAFFTSVNLVTLSGFTQSFAAVSEYPPLGIWLVAITALASATTVLVGSGLFLARLFGLELSVLRLLVYALGLQIACAVAGVAFAAGQFDATSAASGLGLFTVRSPASWLKVVLVTLSIPSAIGPILLVSLFGLHSPTRRRGLMSGCWIALAVIYFVGLVLLRIVGLSWMDASLATIDTRSLGSGFVPPSGVPQWVMAALMLLGAAPGGVAGGIGVIPIVILIQSGWSALRGRTVDPILGAAVAWIFVFLAALVVLVIALASTQPQLPGDRMLFLAISAICNAGLSHDPVSLSREGLFLLSGAMLVGRMLPLVMLCWMACISDTRREREDSTLKAVRAD